MTGPNSCASAALGSSAKTTQCGLPIVAALKWNVCPAARISSFNTSRGGLIGALTLCVLAYAVAAIFYALASRTLRKAMKTKKARWFMGGRYEEDKFEADLQTLLDEYGNRGYLEAAVAATDVGLSAPV